MQDDILFEIRSDLGLIKKDQQNLYTIVEKLANSLEKITDNLKDEHHDLRKKCEVIQDRILILEQFNLNKKNTVSLWIAPVTSNLITAAITSAICLALTTHFI